MPRTWYNRLAAGLIVAIALGLALASSSGDSLIVDEVPHIGAGYSYVRTLDMHLNPEHPPLVKDIAGLPMLFMGLDERAFTLTPWTTDVNGQWNFGRALIFNSGNDADAIKMVARTSVLLVFFLSGCCLMWHWARRRYGDGAGLIALTLWAFSPTVIAHARLVTTDVAAAVGVLAATYFFLRLLRHQSRANFIWASLTLGLALLAKFNTVLLAPFFIVVAILYALDGRLSVRARTRATRAVVLTALVGLTAFAAVVMPVYLVQTSRYPMVRQISDAHAILDDQRPGLIHNFTLWAVAQPILRAAAQWTLGLDMVTTRASSGNTIYWLGRVVNAGGPWYFPIVYFLKEPLAWWILCAMALTGLAFHRRRHAGEPVTGSWWSRHTDEWVWLLWLAIYWSVSIRSPLNIGVRHLLPVYPFTILLVTGRLSVLTQWLKTHDRPRMKWFSIAIGLLLGWYVFESVHVFPSYLTYFNQIAGGPSGGYRYVTDSNLDWGQDLKRLGEWVQEQNIKKLSLDYFGWSDPSYYLKDHELWTTANAWRDAQDFINRNQSDGWVAVSGTFLQESIYKTDQAHGSWRWLLDYTPTTVIGNSIFVFHITQ